MQINFSYTPWLFCFWVTVNEAKSDSSIVRSIFLVKKYEEPPAFKALFHGWCPWFHHGSSVSLPSTQLSLFFQIDWWIFMHCPHRNSMTPVTYEFGVCNRLASPLLNLEEYWMNRR
jgi:hypothetical protein